MGLSTKLSPRSNQSKPATRKFQRSSEQPAAVSRRQSDSPPKASKVRRPKSTGEPIQLPGNFADRPRQRHFPFACEPLIPALRPTGSPDPPKADLLPVRNPICHRPKFNTSYLSAPRKQIADGSRIITAFHRDAKFADMFRDCGVRTVLPRPHRGVGADSVSQSLVNPRISGKDQVSARSK